MALSHRSLASIHDGAQDRAVWAKLTKQHVGAAVAGCWDDLLEATGPSTL